MKSPGRGVDFGEFIFFHAVDEYLFCRASPLNERKKRTANSTPSAPIRPTGFAYQRPSSDSRARVNTLVRSEQATPSIVLMDADRLPNLLSHARSEFCQVVLEILPFALA
jgi:hypothetical protein